MYEQALKPKGGRKRGSRESDVNVARGGGLPLQEIIIHSDNESVKRGRGHRPAYLWRDNRKQKTPSRRLNYAYWGTFRRLKGSRRAEKKTGSREISKSSSSGREPRARDSTVPLIGTRRKCI